MTLMAIYYYYYYWNTFPHHTRSIFIVYTLYRTVNDSKYAHIDKPVNLILESLFGQVDVSVTWLNPNTVTRCGNFRNPRKRRAYYNCGRIVIGSLVRIEQHANITRFPLILCEVEVYAHSGKAILYSCAFRMTFIHLRFVTYYNLRMIYSL